MERTWKCTRLVLARLWKSAVTVTILYFAFVIAITIILNAAAPDGIKTTQSSLVFFAFIYLFFALYSLYKNIWNNLLLFSNTRKLAFEGILLATLCMDAAFAVLSILSDRFTILLGGSMHFKTGSVYGLLDPGTSPGGGLIYYFGLLFAVSGFSLLYGALLYKIGKTFHIIFWIAFGIFWSVGVPLCANTRLLTTAAAWYLGYRNILLSSLHLLITGGIFTGIAFLLARRQPQRA